MFAGTSRYFQQLIQEKKYAVCFVFTDGFSGPPIHCAPSSRQDVIESRFSFRLLFCRILAKFHPKVAGGSGALASTYRQNILQLADPSRDQSQRRQAPVACCGTLPGTRLELLEFFDGGSKLGADPCHGAMFKISGF